MMARRPKEIPAAAAHPIRNHNCAAWTTILTQGGGALRLVLPMRSQRMTGALPPCLNR